jgi:methyl-accepting chemotaxis protein
MEQTTIGNKKIANGVLSKKRSSRRADDAPEVTSPVELQNMLQALRAMRAGDFSVRMGVEQDGILGKIADTFNDIVASNEQMAQQLERVGQVVGREGETRHRVKFGTSNGAWGEMESSVNTLIDDLLWPTKEVTTAVAAVAQGDLLKTVRLEVDGRPLKGEFLEAASIVNTMIKQLSVFTSEVTRVAREVGTEGKLGGQAQVREVTGVWKDLTESVNSMANNLTAQVRNIAEVTIAVADGDLSKKITVDVRGEILQLKEAINTMVDQLRSTMNLRNDLYGDKSMARRHNSLRQFGRQARPSCRRRAVGIDDASGHAVRFRTQGRRPLQPFQRRHTCRQKQ